MFISYNPNAHILVQVHAAYRSTCFSVYLFYLLTYYQLIGPLGFLLLGLPVYLCICLCIILIEPETLVYLPVMGFLQVNLSFCFFFLFIHRLGCEVILGYLQSLIIIRLGGSYTRIPSILEKYQVGLGSTRQIPSILDNYLVGFGSYTRIPSILDKYQVGFES